MASEKQIDVAKETEDKIGWTMTCIREMNLNTVKKCTIAYPKIVMLINPDDPNTRILPFFTALRNHAVELARQDITTGLIALQTGGEQIDPQVKSRKKGNILMKRVAARRARTARKGAA